MEMFQRSFTEDDDTDEAVLLEATKDWEDTPPDNGSAQCHSMVRQSPSKRGIRDYFCR